MIATYDHDLIALKKLQPNTSILVDKDSQPFVNMPDATKLVLERAIDEATVRGNDDAGPSNHISLMRQLDSDISQVPNLICPQSNEEETIENEDELGQRL